MRFFTKRNNLKMLKREYINRLLLFLIGVCQTITVLAQPRYVQIAKDNIACLYGLQDQDKNWVVPATYIEMQKGPNKTFFVREGESWGVIKQDGKRFLPVKYQACNECYLEGYPGYIVKENNKYGLMSLSGRKILDSKYDVIRSYGNFFYIKYGESSGVADTNKILFAGKYDIRFIEKKSLLKITNSDRKTGIINYKLDTVVPFKYDDVFLSYAGGYFMENKRHYCYVNEKKDTIIKPWAKLETAYSTYDFDETELKTVALSYGKKWGLYSMEKKWLTDTIYDELEPIKRHASSGTKHPTWEFKRNDKMGYLDDGGHVLFEPVYPSLELYPWSYRDSTDAQSSSFVVFASDNRLTGILNPDGTTLLPVNYHRVKLNANVYFSNENEIWKFESGGPYTYSSEKPVLTKLVFFASFDKDVDIYTLNGKPLFVEKHTNNTGIYLEPVDHYLNNITLKRTIYEATYNYKTLYFDKKGNTVIDPFAGKTIIKEIYNGNILYATRNEWRGYADSTGKDILDTLYPQIYFQDDEIWVRKDTNHTCHFRNLNQYSNCSCNWMRFDVNGKRKDNVMYDLPLISNGAAYVGGKAGLLNYQKQGFLVEPIYSDIVRFNHFANFLFALNGDSTFKVYSLGGRLMFKDDFKSILPMTVYTDDYAQNLYKKGYSTNFIVMESEKSKIMLDFNGRIVKKKKMQDEIMANIHSYYNDYNPLVNIGPHIIYFKSPSKNALNFLSSYIFAYHRDRYTTFPGGNEVFIQNCGSVSTSHQKPVFPENWEIAFSDDKILSVKISFNFYTKEYDNNFNYINFVNENGKYERITIESLFKNETEIESVLNNLFVEYIASRTDLNLDCSNSATYYKNTNGKFLLMNDGIHFTIFGNVNLPVTIEWQKLLPYAKPGGLIAYYAGLSKIEK
jgi:hypothetical protein